MYDVVIVGAGSAARLWQVGKLSPAGRGADSGADLFRPGLRPVQFSRCGDGRPEDSGVYAAAVQALPVALR